MVTPVTETRARLSAATLARARADVRPGYDRTGEPTIVHLGVGNFVRAHLALYADDLLQLGRAALIRGVSLHNPQVEAQLAPQDCYYTVAEQEPDAEPSLRVVGSIAAVSTGREAALRALCATATRLVTLTITEKGYDLDPADLEHPDRPVSAPGIVALALEEWRRTGHAPPVVAALDNLAENGSLLRTRVLEVAQRLNPALPPWIEDKVLFPNSVVDRMVPAPGARDLADIAARLGLVDLGAVVTESHRSWVMSGAGDPRLVSWGEAGVALVPDATPYEQRKLWLLNGPHSALAYAGLLGGHVTIASAADDSVLSSFVRLLVDDVLEVVRLPPALRGPDFAAGALRRFRNANLGHTCTQVGADGSRKLPQRFAAVVAARLRSGLDTTRVATVVALWIAATAGVELRGSRLPAVDDPDAALLSARLDQGLDAVVDAALAGRFDPAFAPTVTVVLRHLATAGMGAVACQA
jgi:fructuronate reductase